MKETTVQIDGMMSIFDDAGVEKQIKRRDGVCLHKVSSGESVSLKSFPGNIIVGGEAVTLSSTSVSRDRVPCVTVYVGLQFAGRTNCLQGG